MKPPLILKKKVQLPFTPPPARRLLKEKQKNYPSSPLTSQHQLLVCELLAEFQSTTDVSRYMASLGAHISPSNVGYYLRHPEWKKIIESFQQKYGQYLMQEPLYHKRKRLERLETIYQETSSEAGKDFSVRSKIRSEKLSVLKEAREECKPLEEFSSINTNIQVIQFNQMDDRQLMERRDAILTKLKKLKPKGVSHGASGEAQEEIRVPAVEGS